MKKLVAILALFFTIFLGAIDLQTASKMELMNLKGVGDKKADAIIEYRKNNTISNPDDLKNVKGFGETLINNIKAQIESNKKKDKSNKPSYSKSNNTNSIKDKNTNNSSKWYISYHLTVLSFYFLEERRVFKTLPLFVCQVQSKSAPLVNTYLLEISNKPASLFLIFIINFTYFLVERGTVSSINISFRMYWWRCAGSNRSLKIAHISVYMFSKVEKFHFITAQLPKAIIKLRFKISL